MVIWPSCSGESNCFISFDLNEEFLIFEGEQCSIPAFPLLESALVVAVKLVHFAPHTFALRAQAFLSRGNKNPVTSRPAQFKAAGILFQQTKTSGFVHE